MPPKRLNAKTPPGPETAAYNPPPAPPKASPALQRARVNAALKMHKYGDTEKEKALVEQWEKKEPARRITKKSSVVHAKHSKPDQRSLNKHEADKFSSMVERSFKYIDGLSPGTPVGIQQALFTKNLAARIEKHGVKQGPATAMAAVAGDNMGSLRRSLFDKR